MSAIICMETLTFGASALSKVKSACRENTSARRLLAFFVQSCLLDLSLSDKSCSAASKLCSSSYMRIARWLLSSVS